MTIDHHDLPIIIKEIISAQDEGRQIAPITSRYPLFGMSSAYELMQLIHRERLQAGATAAGRKIGFTNSAMWPLFGVHEPVWGYMYAGTVEYLSGNSGVCRLAGFCEPRIEPEVVVHFHSAPPAGADMAAIIECIDWIAHGFEIVQSNFPGWKFQAADAVADGSFHGALFVGEQKSLQSLGPQAQDSLKTFSVALSCGDVLRETGVGANVLGSPLAAIAYLIATLAKQPQQIPLQAGEVITTGTLTSALSVQPGETWHTHIDGIALPGLSLHFTE